MSEETAHSPVRVGVVVLAAGASSRMGRPKLLLPWSGTTVLGHLLHQWQRLRADQIAVVLAPTDTDIPSELDRLRIGNVERLVNPHPEHGMFSSIRVAAEWTGWKPAITHWLISLGDQPHVRTSTLAALLTEAAAHPDQICQPARNDRPRHPVLLPRRQFRELPATTDKDLKQFLTARSGSRRTFDSDDPGLDLDLDTPADYENALRLL